MTSLVELRVPPSQDGLRLDRFLAEALPDTSRTLIQKHIEAGAVTVDGEPPARGSKTPVLAGSLVRYAPPAPVPAPRLTAEDLPVTFLYEDSDLVVIDKPAGLVVHPALGHASGTLVNALLHHVKDLGGIGGELRPGIVHRLDKGTTGVLVVAKTAFAHERLTEMFRGRAVKKEYLAVVLGVPRAPKGTIDTLYARHPKDRKRFSSKVTAGKRAVSHYRVAEAFRGAALLEVRIETGRTHQIRVHLSDLGHPLIGDAAYGGKRKQKDPALAKAIDGFDRPALHAEKLAFAHPRTKEALAFRAPIPDDLAALLARLRAMEAP